MANRKAQPQAPAGMTWMYCDFFIGPNRQDPCERCGMSWADHYGPAAKPTLCLVKSPLRTVTVEPDVRSIELVAKIEADAERMHRDMERQLAQRDARRDGGDTEQ